MSWVARRVVKTWRSEPALAWIAGHSARFVNPLAPRPKVVGTTLVGDPLEDAHIDAVVLGNRDVPHVAGLRMFVSELDVASLPTNDVVAVCSKHADHLPSGEIGRDHTTA